MPAYKADRYLEPALDSILSQTYRDWELIVVEDGSRDRTEEIVTTFAKKVSQPVSFLRHEKNKGLPATRNTGISAAKSDWVALLDSDDLWTPTHLETLAAHANKTGNDLLHSGCILFDNDSGAELEIRKPTEENTRSFPISLFRGDYIIQPSTVLMTKDLWRRAGQFDPDHRYGEDIHMWLRCARAGGRFAYTGQITCRYRRHGSAMTANSAEMAEGCALILEKHLDWTAIPEAIRRDRCAVAWSSAARLRRKSAPALAVDYFQRALRIKWYWKWWAMSIVARFQLAKKS